MVSGSNLECDVVIEHAHGCAARGIVTSDKHMVAQHLGAMYPNRVTKRRQPRERI